jgi:hypothetical protein
MRVLLLLVSVPSFGLGVYLLRLCSNRFMLLRHAKSPTPYLYGLGGILSLLLMTAAVFGVALWVIGLRRMW